MYACIYITGNTYGVNYARNDIDHIKKNPGLLITS